MASTMIHIIILKEFSSNNNEISNFNDFRDVSSDEIIKNCFVLPI